HAARKNARTRHGAVHVSPFDERARPPGASCARAGGISPGNRLRVFRRRRSRAHRRGRRSRLVSDRSHPAAQLRDRSRRRIHRVTDGDDLCYSIRITDTTLKTAWFFIAGDYNAFSEIANTSDQTVNVGVAFWAANGTFIANTSISLNANGNVAINAADFVNRI